MASRLKLRRSGKPAPAAAPTGAAAAAADSMGGLTASERQTIAAAAAKLPGRTDLPRLGDLVPARKSGQLGGYFLGDKRGRGTLGGHYLGPLTKAQREAKPLPPVEVQTAAGTTQIPQSETQPNLKKKPMEKKIEKTETETVPAHDTKVETKTEETQHQPETKVETKTEQTEPAE
jgi:hypothetical protein